MFSIACRHLTKRFASSGRPAADKGSSVATEPANDLSFDFAAGKITAIVGQSGCGKTTLLRMIAGLEVPNAGEIVFCDETGAKRHPVISTVFQEPRLFPWLNVRDNIALAVRSKPEAERNALIDETLETVGLTQAAFKMPHELSGGMAQRVGMARALCRHPDILLLDEAFSALDALTREKLRGEFIDIAARRPMTTILVTHDVLEAVLLSSTICKLEAGAVAQSWTIEAPYPRRLGQPGLARLADGILASFFEEKTNTCLHNRTN